MLNRIFLPCGLGIQQRIPTGFSLSGWCPGNSFSVLVYLLAVLSDGEQFQNVKRAILEPCVPGVLGVFGYLISEPDVNFL